MFTSLKKLLARKTTSRKARMNRYVPQVEGLEARQMLTVGAAFDGIDVLTITSNDISPTNEKIVITDNGTQGNGNISLKIGNAAAIPFNGIREIHVDLKGGKDKVTYNLTGDLQAGLQRVVDVKLGSGKDTFFMGLTKDILAGASFDLDVQGESTTDTILLQTLPAFTQQVQVVNGQQVLVQVPDPWVVATDAVFDADLKGGSSKDTIRYIHTAPVLAQVNGVLKLNMDGEGTGDVLTASMGTNVGASGLLDVDMVGGASKDTIDFAYGGELDGQMHLNVDGGASADGKLKAIVNLSAGSSGQLGTLEERAAVRGGDGDDKDMEFRVRTKVTDVDLEVFATIDGEAGVNEGKRTANVEFANINTGVVN